MTVAGVSNWPHNALRHTFVSSRLATSKNAALTAYEAGHTIEVMKSHYDAVVDPTDATNHFLVEIETENKGAQA